MHLRDCRNEGREYMQSLIKCWQKTGLRSSRSNGKAADERLKCHWETSSCSLKLKEAGR